MQGKIKQNKKFLFFILIIIVMGIICGFIYFNLLNSSTKNNIINTLNNFNFQYSNSLLKDLIMMSILLVTSFFVVGLPLSIFYLFYECLSMGFLVNAFLISYKFKGLIFAIIYLIYNRLLILILLIFFIKKILNIGRFVIGSIVYKNDLNIKEKLLKNFRKSLIIIGISFLVNLFLFILSPYFYKLFSFLLK